ncbi:MAG TPA: alpha/beta hydrolase [Steroidobacteraceae bacterium]|nr:alpha/beta hydrolase [Steroidobacteraceae bacterium]
MMGIQEPAFAEQLLSMNIKKVLTVMAIAAGVVYGGFLCALYIMQDSIIYPGAKTKVDAVTPKAQGAEVLRISTSQGNIEAIFLPATAGADAKQNPLVIFGHGNGEVIDYWVAALDGFRERGIGVLLVEYPGYGRSTGAPSEASIRTAMDGAYDRIAADPQVDPTRIFGFGQSIGGGAICLLAKDRSLRALILLSTFPSLDIFTAAYWAPSFLLHDHFDNVSTVAHFAGPVLVIHGRDDRLIPWEQAQRLAAASAHSTFKLYDCGHGCWEPERVPFWRDAMPFLISAGILQLARVGS